MHHDLPPLHAHFLPTIAQLLPTERPLFDEIGHDDGEPVPHICSATGDFNVVIERVSRVIGRLNIPVQRDAEPITSSAGAPWPWTKGERSY